MVKTDVAKLLGEADCERFLFVLTEDPQLAEVQSQSSQQQNSSISFHRIHVRLNKNLIRASHYSK